MMGLFKLVKNASKVLRGNSSKEKTEEYLKSLKRRRKTIKKILEKDISDSVRSELKEDLKSIKRIEEKIKKRKEKG